MTMATEHRFETIYVETFFHLYRIFFYFSPTFFPRSARAIDRCNLSQVIRMGKDRGRLEASSIFG